MERPRCHCSSSRQRCEKFLLVDFIVFILYLGLVQNLHITTAVPVDEKPAPLEARSGSANFTSEEQVEHIVFCPHAGATLTHPGDCTKFILCRQGWVTVEDCPPMLKFDESLNICTREAVCRTAYDSTEDMTTDFTTISTTEESSTTETTTATTEETTVTTEATTSAATSEMTTSGRTTSATAEGRTAVDTTTSVSTTELTTSATTTTETSTTTSTEESTTAGNTTETTSETTTDHVTSTTESTSNATETEEPTRMHTTTATTPSTSSTPVARRPAIFDPQINIIADRDGGRIKIGLRPKTRPTTPRTTRPSPSTPSQPDISKGFWATIPRDDETPDENVIPEEEEPQKEKPREEDGRRPRPDSQRKDYGRSRPIDRIDEGRMPYPSAPRDGYIYPKPETQPEDQGPGVMYLPPEEDQDSAATQAGKFDGQPPTDVGSQARRPMYPQSWARPQQQPGPGRGDGKWRKVFVYCKDPTHHHDKPMYAGHPDERRPSRPWEDQGPPSGPGRGQLPTCPRNQTARVPEEPDTKYMGDENYPYRQDDLEGSDNYYPSPSGQPSGIQGHMTYPQPGYWKQPQAPARGYQVDDAWQHPSYPGQDDQRDSGRPYRPILTPISVDYDGYDQDYPSQPGSINEVSQEQPGRPSGPKYYKPRPTHPGTATGRPQHWVGPVPSGTRDGSDDQYRTGSDSLEFDGYRGSWAPKDQYPKPATPSWQQGQRDQTKWDQPAYHRQPYPVRPEQDGVRPSVGIQIQGQNGNRTEKGRVKIQIGRPQVTGYGPGMDRQYDGERDPSQWQRPQIGIQSHGRPDARPYDDGQRVDGVVKDSTVDSGGLHVAQSWSGQVYGQDDSSYRSEDFGEHDHHGWHHQPKSVGDFREENCLEETATLFPHPSDCTLYIQCVHGSPLARDCGPGTHFNPTLQICDFPSQAGCTSRA